MAVLNDILDISKIEAERLTLEEKNFSVAHAIGEVLQLEDATAHAKGLRLSHEIDPLLPDVLCGDVTRLKQILFNFIGNAIKFSEHGRIIVRVRIFAEDSVSLLLKIEVSDQGIGISPGQQARLFHAFTQAGVQTHPVRPKVLRRPATICASRSVTWCTPAAKSSPCAMARKPSVWRNWSAACVKNSSPDSGFRLPARHLGWGMRVRLGFRVTAARCGKLSNHGSDPVSTGNRRQAHTRADCIRLHANRRVTPGLDHSVRAATGSLTGVPLLSQGKEGP